MSSGTDQAIEGEIIDPGPVHYTAQEQQRYVNLTHALVFLKKDAHLAEICAKKAHHLMRQHLRECFRALVADENAHGEADIYSDTKHEVLSESI